VSSSDLFQQLLQRLEDAEEGWVDAWVAASRHLLALQSVPDQTYLPPPQHHHHLPTCCRLITFLNELEGNFWKSLLAHQSTELVYDSNVFVLEIVVAELVFGACVSAQTTRRWGLPGLCAPRARLSRLYECWPDCPNVRNQQQRTGAVPLGTLGTALECTSI
jgi:hypothetical protein